jgi:hypothetical protein
MVKHQTVKISEIKLNPNNPRLIKDDKFKKLVQSIKDFPEMLDIRPIVVNSDMIILGGNMRFKACKEAGLKEVPIIVADNLTEEQQREFLIKDNTSGGEWDFEMLANEWDNEQLEAWGLDLPEFVNDYEENNNEAYTTKIDAPVYEPKNEKPQIKILYDSEKYKELILEIENSLVSEDVKTFLKVSASRHIVFNYENIADFYAHSEKDIQELMEKSALVIIDFNKSIELGFTKLNDEIGNQYKSDYE